MIETLKKKIRNYHFRIWDTVFAVQAGFFKEENQPLKTDPTASDQSSVAG